jgi:hypothetical protein
MQWEREGGQETGRSKREWVRVSRVVVAWKHIEVNSYLYSIHSNGLWKKLRVNGNELGDGVWVDRRDRLPLNPHHSK